MLWRKFLISLALFAAPAAHGQAVRLTDINTSHTGPAAATDRRGEFFGIREMETVGSRMWFTADDGVHGVELWSTDGTAAGTRRESDLCPGRCSAHPRTLTAFGSRLFFIADDGRHGFEPWITDGTAAGTAMLADVGPGLLDGGLWWAAASSGHVVFTATTAATGWEPWVTDGTAAGTRLLADLRPGPESSQAMPLGAVGGRVFFAANDGIHGQEMWSTDGSTAVLLETNPGPGGGTGQFVNLSEKAAATSSGLFFPGADPDHGLELWFTDGTPGGTRLVRDIFPGIASAAARGLIAWNDRVFFFAEDGVHGQELWISDGSEEGTRLVFETIPGPESSDFLLSLLTTPTGVFCAGPSAESTHALWFSDGTAAGSRKLLGARTSVARPPPVAAGTGLLFYGYDETHGTEPWFSDGTEAGTVRLADLAPGPESSFGLGDFVRGWDRASLGPLGFFWIWSPGHDFELWSSDGTAAGTHLVKDVNHQASSIRVEPLFHYFQPEDVYQPVAPAATPVGLAFLATDGPLDPAHPTPGTTGLELWHVTHEDREVRQIVDLAPGPASSFLTSLVASPVAALFSNAHHEVFATSGAGVTRLATPSALGGLIRLPTAVVGSGFALEPSSLESTSIPFGGEILATDGHRAYAFTLGFPDPFRRIAVTDGTVEGSREVLLDHNFFALSPTGVDDREVAFFGAPASEGLEPWIWRSDDTVERLRDIRPGSEPSIRPGYDLSNAEWEGWLPRLVTTGRTAFFAANDGVHGEELWATDATTPGTRLVADLFPGTRGADIRRLTPLGSRVFFVADDGVHGREIWVSDGTATGTRLVRDLAPGTGSAVPQELTAVGDLLVFSAWTPSQGRELWISDGTAAGTVRLTDLAPGPASSSPVTFVPAGGWLYFTANDNHTGDELWRLPLAALQTAAIFADGFESGDLTLWSSP